MRKRNKVPTADCYKRSARIKNYLLSGIAVRYKLIQCLDVRSKKGCFIIQAVTYCTSEYNLGNMPTRGSQKVMHIIFYYTLFTRWVCENFTELHHNIVEGVVIFQVGLHHCRQSCNFEQRHAFLPGKSCSLSLSRLQPPAHCSMLFEGPKRW